MWECEKVFDEQLGWLEKPRKNVGIEFDSATIKWFNEHPGETAWMADCPECKQRYIVELGHHCYEKEFNKNCDSDGLMLNPGNPDKCLGNGKMRKIEYRCDECDHFLICFPEWEKGEEYAEH